MSGLRAVQRLSSFFLPGSVRPRGRHHFVGLTVLTLIALCSVVASLDSEITVLECTGNLQLIPEPAGWRAWPVEKNGLALGGTLSGFEFHHQPIDWRIGGYWGTELTDPALCPHSQVELSSWFAVEQWHSRGPDELSLYRNDATGAFVVSGIQANDPAGERAQPSFVTAFRRDRRPQTFAVENKVYCPLVPLLVIAAVGATLLGARFERPAVYARWVGWAIFFGFAALLATFAFAVGLAIGDGMVAG